ncbi:hypothetical protein M2139_002141 [Enterococcus sp. PF1-24]|uniref:hypothetical protein n=1 Tax=unclassified Enterococcus TaxID=2608891 RepID=UPI00247526C2|nr:MULTISPECIES: hypothetical protein [unclassified Enterococcus]MDH6365175.1 hypothetical protein [Enterococcus sp. PFB1-1]MDH6402241.1 hypothetical protein [Enterococcus sp. PF1-24]
MCKKVIKWVLAVVCLLGMGFLIPESSALAVTEADKPIGGAYGEEGFWIFDGDTLILDGGTLMDG